MEKAAPFAFATDLTSARPRHFRARALACVGDAHRNAFRIAFDQNAHMAAFDIEFEGVGKKLADRHACFILLRDHIGLEAKRVDGDRDASKARSLANIVDFRIDNADDIRRVVHLSARMGRQTGEFENAVENVEHLFAAAANMLDELNGVFRAR